jgi:hypothetical protein
MYKHTLSLLIALLFLSGFAMMPGCPASDDDDSGVANDDDATANDDDATANDDDATANDDDATADDDDATADDDDSGGDDDDSATPTACETYCSLAMGSCTGENAIYPDVGSCLDACAGIPATGNDGDPSGNTVQCRTYHLGVAATMQPELHCTHGNQFGGTGATGFPCSDDLCDPYCALMAENCTGAASQFADAAACATSCSGYPATGTLGDTGGDTVQCRIYHAEAAPMDPTLHCPHAGPTGDGVCVDPVGVR